MRIRDKKLFSISLAIAVLCAVGFGFACWWESMFGAITLSIVAVLSAAAAYSQVGEKPKRTWEKKAPPRRAKARN